MITEAALLLLLPALATPAPAANWDSAAQPVYQAAESFTDGVYSFLDRPLSFLLPGESSSRTGDIPQESSYDLFADELRSKQDRAERLIAAALPAGPVSSGALASWRGRAISEETKALTDTFAATLASRYDLKRLAPGSTGFAGDFDDWGAGRFASAALLGGVYAYAAGLRADLAAGPLRFGVDVNSGAALRRSTEGVSRRLVSLHVSPANSPLFVETSWCLRDGRVGHESLGLNYSRRF
jgi:hypothetical protein